jgi:hypothetical protein
MNYAYRYLILCKYFQSYIFNKKRIGYLGWLGHKNLGDDVLFEAFEKIFQPLFSMVPYSQRISTMEEKLGIKLFDTACLGGGTLIFTAFLTNFKKMVDNCKYSFILGSGVIDSYCGKLMDVHWNPIDWREVLSKVNFIGVRGPLSQDLLANIGINSSIVGDTALLFSKDSFLPKKRNKHIMINIGTSFKYGFGNKQSIINNVIEISKVLLKDNWSISLVYVAPEDRDPTLHLYRSLGNHRVQLIDSHLGLDSYLKLASEVDILLGMKLHSVILAHCVGTPSIIMGYQPKCLDYMESFKLSQYCHMTNNLSAKTITNQIYEIYENIELHQRTINYWTRFYKNSLEISATKIINEILIDNN